MTVVDKLLSKIETVTESGCWIWMGSVNPNGYGSFTDAKLVPERRTFSAHRYIYEAMKGPIPDNCDLDHLCRVRCCVNPDHLEPVSRRINLLRGRGRTARNAQVTHCPKNHPYDETNTYILRGKRFCRKCRVIACTAIRKRHQVAGEERKQ